MASPLPAADRERLVRMLGMLGSSFEGERAAAGLLASRLLAEHKLSWADVIAGGVLCRPAPAPYRPPPAPYPPSPGARSAWQETIRLCLRSRADLSDWEIGFLECVGARHQPPTKRQSEILAQIIEKLRAAERQAAR